MFVVYYETKFEVLSRYCPYYNCLDAEGSKCVKFENGLRPEIKEFIGYHEICRFSVLVNKCRIYDEDIRARYTYYKSVNEKKFSNQNHRKPYSNPGAKGNQKAAIENEISGGDAMFPLRCGNYGKLGHRVPECNNTTPNYGEQGHINTYYEKPKKEPGVGQNVQAKGKVFALSGVEVSRSDNLI
ncbi:uncharacterized protein LOC127130377 [Lathyrus oleraceus]|uniref:uncharacterized protein LOC127130377 n=1 Tax=Pisum sativum TaxID=3888 RepID=UPI0021CE67B2|nr:uncharacterized protein LOC127130377 [Pisum sativum]